MSSYNLRQYIFFNRQTQEDNYLFGFYYEPFVVYIQEHNLKITLQKVEAFTRRCSAFSYSRVTGRSKVFSVQSFTGHRVLDLVPLQASIQFYLKEISQHLFSSKILETF